MKGPAEIYNRYKINEIKHVKNYLKIYFESYKISMSVTLFIYLVSVPLHSD